MLCRCVDDDELNVTHQGTEVVVVVVVVPAVAAAATAAAAAVCCVYTSINSALVVCFIWCQDDKRVLFPLEQIEVMAG